MGSGSLPVGRNGLSVMLLLCERLSNGEVRAGKKREGVRGGGCQITCPPTSDVLLVLMLLLLLLRHLLLRLLLLLLCPCHRLSVLLMPYLQDFLPIVARLLHLPSLPSADKEGQQMEGVGAGAGAGAGVQSATPGAAKERLGGAAASSHLVTPKAAGPPQSGGGPTTVRASPSPIRRWPQRPRYASAMPVDIVEQAAAGAAFAAAAASAATASASSSPSACGGGGRGSGRMRRRGAASSSSEGGGAVVVAIPMPGRALHSPHLVVMIRGKAEWERGRLF